MPMIAAPSIWARTRSGLTTRPQSTAMSTRGMVTCPSCADRDIATAADIGEEAAMDRDAATLAAAAACRPSRSFRGEIEHAAQPAGIDRIGDRSRRRSSGNRRPSPCRSIMRGAPINWRRYSTGSCRPPRPAHRRRSTPRRHAECCRPSDTSRCGRGWRRAVLQRMFAMS